MTDATPTIDQHASAAAIDVDLRTGVTVGRFVIVDRVGSGGMGVVYRAYDKDLDRSVAIKLLRPHDELAFAEEAAVRLQREAQAMAKVSHPNVVPVYQVGSHEGRIFLVMEYVDGETLDAWCVDPARTPAEIITAYIAAGRGLAAAHAAGMIHRDFKPENVLVGRDGRIRVGDFGLVGLAESAGAPPALAPDAHPGLTQSGTLLGTPRYMAPEQHRREAATARSDQFSFSVALWTALVGTAPFAGDTYRELVLNVLDGHRRDPAREARIPTRVRRALERGLAIDPAQRFPDIAAMIAALEPPTRRRWAIAAVLGATALGVAALALVATDRGGAAPAREPLCTGSAERLAAVWGPTRSEQVRNAFAATGLARAGVLADIVLARLDAYRDAWVTAHHDACAATHLRGDQSEAIMDLRMRCLDQRARELDAFATDLTGTSASGLDQAVIAAYKLTLIAACADVDALSAPVPLPTDPDLRARVVALGSQLAAVQAHLLTGRYPEAVTLARQALPTAQAIQYEPLLAELTTLLGKAETNAGHFAAARASLEDATGHAESSRHDLIAAESWIVLVMLPGPAATSQAAARRADAAVRRVGDPDRLRARLEQNLGLVASRQNDQAAAIDHWERALALYRRAFGDIHPDMAGVYNNLAATYRVVGRNADARAASRRASEIFSATYGEQHPSTALAHAGLGVQLQQDGLHDEAQHEFERAMTALPEILGDDHPHVAMYQTALSSLYLERGHFDDAWTTISRVAERERARGAEQVGTYVIMASIRHGQGDLTAARTYVARAMDLIAHNAADPERWRSAVHGISSSIARSAGHWKRAEHEATLAVEDMERFRGATSSFVAAPLLLLARAHIDGGHLNRANAPLDRALRMTEQSLPVMRAEAHLVLAELRWRRGQHAEARAAAAVGAALLADLDLTDGPAGREIAAWQTKHAP